MPRAINARKRPLRVSFFNRTCLCELLGGRCFSSGGFGGGSGLGSFLAAAAGRLLGLLRSGEGRFVEVDELDEGHLGGVTLTESGVEDTEVSARTVGDLRRNGAEEFGDGVLVLQVAEDDTADTTVVALE